MRTAILITSHYLKSRRKAGFHWLADALHRRGWRVIMMTAPMSWVSVLRRDHRLQYGVREQAGKLIWSDERLASYVWWTPVHPVGCGSKLIDRLIAPLFRGFESRPLGPITAEIEQAGLFIFESTPALVLAERFRAMNPAARLVYRVSDDLKTLRVHPELREREMKLASLFDCISSPSPAIHAKFAHLPTARLDPHGVPATLYDGCTTNPYAPGRSHAVFAGVARLDRWFVDIISRHRPHVDLHIIGPFRERPQRANIHYYGELPFEETVPYVKFADVGLQTITGGPGAASFADSLKVLQYSWCRLPILVPSFLPAQRANMVSYVPGDRRAALAAFDRAVRMERNDAWQAGVQTWDTLAARLTGEHAPPPITAEPMPDHVPVSRA